MLTEEEVFRLSGIEPFSDLRQNAKTCFPAGTKILTNIGEINIEDLVDLTIKHKLVPVDSKYKIKALTDTGEYEDITHTYFGYSAKWVEFSLSNNNTISVTDTHEMVVIRGAEELKIPAHLVKDTDLFININFSTMEISRSKVAIRNISYINKRKSEACYCITVEPSHNILIRQNGGEIYKTSNCNFGMLFGISYKKFAIVELETKWSIERARKFIADNNLQKRLVYMKEKHSDYSEDMCCYFTVASYLKDNFFKTYPGLENRIKRNEKLGKERGYIRSYHGAIRRVPMLSLGIDEETEKPRIHENFKELANMVNITSNTSIQDDECSTINSKIVKYENSDLGKSNPIVEMTHDSVDFYVEKENAVETLLTIKELFESPNEVWQRGIKFTIDMKITDFEDEKQYYKSKTSMKLSQFLEKYNGNS